MFNAKQFREDIIQPALLKIQLMSPEAEELLFFTAAVESNLGVYLRQVGGPALGVYQCEPATHNDIWRKFIFANARYIQLFGMNFSCPRIPENERLIYDLHYATAIARIHYLRMPGKLPAVDDIDGIWEYYKKYYNTPLGKAEKDQSIAAYKKANK